MGRVGKAKMRSLEQFRNQGVYSVGREKWQDCLCMWRRVREREPDVVLREEEAV